MLLFLHALIADITNPLADNRRAGKEYEFLLAANENSNTLTSYQDVGRIQNFLYRNKQSLTGTTAGYTAAGALLGISFGPLGIVAGAAIGALTGFIIAATVNKSIEASSVVYTKQTTEPGWGGDGHVNRTILTNPGVASEGARDVRRGILWGSFLALVGIGLAVSGLFVIPGLALFGTTGAIVAQGVLGMSIGLWDSTAADAIRQQRIKFLAASTFIFSMMALGTVLMASGLLAPLGLFLLGNSASQAAMLGLGAGLFAAVASALTGIAFLAPKHTNRALTASLMLGLTTLGIALASFGFLPALGLAGLALWGAYTGIAAGITAIAAATYKACEKIKGIKPAFAEAPAIITALGAMLSAMAVPALFGFLAIAAVALHFAASRGRKQASANQTANDLKIDYKNDLTDNTTPQAFRVMGGSGEQHSETLFGNPVRMYRKTEDADTYREAKCVGKARKTLESVACCI